jgi:hypothetical protein
MQNGSDIANQPVVVRLTLVSLTRAGILEAEAMMGWTRDVVVLEVERPRDLSQCSTLSAPSSSEVSRLACRLAEIAGVVEVRVQRCRASLPGPSAAETGDAERRICPAKRGGTQQVDVYCWRRLDDTPFV